MNENLTTKEIATINSKEVAEMMEMEHSKLLRKISGINKDFTEFKFDSNIYWTKSSYVDKKGRSRKCYEITKNGCELIIQRSRKDIKLEKLIEFVGSMEMPIVLSKRKEVSFIEQLEEFLSEYNIKGIKQYPILNYRIDYYIPELKLAIEYDENNHNSYSYEAQEGRQKQIEKELGCKFVRLSDNCSDLKNIAKVSKYIH